MRVSVFGREHEETATQPTPRRSGDPGGRATAGPPPADVDEQIESLLANLEESDVVAAERSLLDDQPVPARRQRHRRRRRRPVSRYDLGFAVAAVVLGLAVGALTVLLANS